MKTRICMCCGARKPRLEFKKIGPRHYSPSCEACQGKLYTKMCSRCGLVKDINDFKRKPRGVFGRGSHCKRCVWVARIKYEYGVSADKYIQLSHYQGGRCAICECLPEQRGMGVLCVDHDHDSGTVRGLLCNGCNTMLGFCGDRPGIFYAAAAYLERYEIPE